MKRHEGKDEADGTDDAGESDAGRRELVGECRERPSDRKMDASVGFEIVSSRRLVARAGPRPAPLAWWRSRLCAWAFRSGSRPGFEQCTDGRRDETRRRPLLRFVGGETADFRNDVLRRNDSGRLWREAQRFSRATRGCWWLFLHRPFEVLVGSNRRGPRRRAFRCHRGDVGRKEQECSRRCRLRGRRLDENRRLERASSSCHRRCPPSTRRARREC